MPEERRSNGFCNLFEIHCKDSFDRLEKKIDKVITKIDSTTQDHISNTNHRVLMESWGKAILISISISALGSFAWLVTLNAK